MLVHNDMLVFMSTIALHVYLAKYLKEQLEVRRQTFLCKIVYRF